MRYEDMEDIVENIYVSDNPPGMYNVDENKAYAEEVDEINTDLIEGVERSFYLGTTDVLGIPYTRVRSPQPITPITIPDIPNVPDEGEDPEPILINFSIDGSVAVFHSDQIGLHRGSYYEMSDYQDIDGEPETIEKNCFHNINATVQNNVLMYISQILNNYMTYKLSAAFAGRLPRTNTYDLISSGHADCTYIWNTSFGMYRQRHDDTYWLYDGFKHNHMLSIIRSYSIIHVLYFNEHYQQRYVRKTGTFDSSEGTFRLGVDQWPSSGTSTLPRPMIKDPCCTRSGSRLPAFSPFVRYVKYWSGGEHVGSLVDGLWDYAIAPSPDRIGDRQLNNIINVIITRILNRDNPDRPIPTTSLKLSNDTGGWTTLTNNVPYTSYQKISSGTPFCIGNTIQIKVTGVPASDEINSIGDFKYTDELSGRNEVPPWCRVAGPQTVTITFPSIRIDVAEDAGNGYYIWREPTFTLTISRLSDDNSGDESDIFWGVASERGISISITDNGIPGETNEWKFYNMESEQEESVNIPQNIPSRTLVRLGNSIMGAGAKYPLIRSSSISARDCDGSTYMNRGTGFLPYPEHIDWLDNLSYIYGESETNRRTELHVTTKSRAAGSGQITYKVVSSMDLLNYYITEANQNVNRRVRIWTTGGGITFTVNRYQSSQCHGSQSIYGKSIITTFKYLHQIVQTQIGVPHPVLLTRYADQSIIYNTKALNGICGQATNDGSGGYYARLSASSPIYKSDESGNIIGFASDIDPFSSNFYNSLPKATIRSTNRRTGTSFTEASIRSEPTVLTRTSAYSRRTGWVITNPTGSIVAGNVPSGTSDIPIFAKVVRDENIAGNTVEITWYLVEVIIGSNIVNGWISSALVDLESGFQESDIPFTCDSEVRQHSTNGKGMGMYLLFSHLENLSNGERRPILTTFNNDTST